MRQPEDIRPRHGWLFAPAREAPRMQVVCIGGACVDRGYNVQDSVAFSSSNVATRIEPSFGGVARNVAENLARLNVHVALMSVVGKDPPGSALVAQLESAGVDTSLMRTVDGATDEYTAILERGRLIAGAADMRAAESITVADLDRSWEIISGAQWLFIDCNLSESVLKTCFARRSIADYHLAADPVSEAKVHKLPAQLNGLDMLFINEGEARAWVGAGAPDDAEALAAALRERGAKAVALSCGERGTVLANGSSIEHIAAPAAARVSVTGAGDALIAGTLWRMLAGDALRDAVSAGANVAGLTIESERSVRADLSPAMIEKY